MRTAALCVAVLIVSSVLGARAQSDSKSTQSGSTVAAGNESSPKSNSGTPPALTKDTEHNWHLQFRGIHGSVGYFRGPASYPYPPYEFTPFFSAADWPPFADPFWRPDYPGYVPNFEYGNGRGEVRLTDAPKIAKVYLNGAYAGTAYRLKHIWLDPGAYDLAIAIPNRETFEQRIYVLSGKTLKIAANQAPNMPEKETP